MGLTNWFCNFVAELLPLEYNVRRGISSRWRILNRLTLNPLSASPCRRPRFITRFRLPAVAPTFFKNAAQTWLRRRPPAKHAKAPALILPFMGIGAQSVLHAVFALIDPLLQFGLVETDGPGGLVDRGRPRMLSRARPRTRTA